MPRHLASLLALSLAAASTSRGQTVTVGTGATPDPGDLVASTLSLPGQGQTFTVPVGFSELRELVFPYVLTVSVRVPSQDRSLALEIFAWDGAAPSGPALFSAPLPVSASDGTVPQFSGALPLTPGQTYLALLHGGGVGPGVPRVPGAADPYPGGSWVGFDGVSYVTRFGTDDELDARFSATFGAGAVTATPEPATVALLGAGLLAAAVAARRRPARG
jgi:hypothetical protein